MGSADTDLAATALAVAFVALFTTFIQVLQQFFATAEGYRRCNSSVMGPWAKRTRRRWRWREFRYETLYTIPKFFVVGTSTNNLAKLRSLLITGDNASRKMTMTPRPVADQDALESNEQVSWIPFLQALHDASVKAIDCSIPHPASRLHERDASMSKQFFSHPALIFQERSWDFTPPDVLRPLASSKLSDICILIRRLGMTFKEDDFRPYTGILNAEGPGQVMTSTHVRGLGPVLRYTYLGDPRPQVDGQPPKSTAFIWKLEADLMGFGILPGNPDFSLPNHAIGTEEDVLARLSEIEPSLHAHDHVQANVKVNLHWVMAFIDLIPLAAPMLRIRGSTAIRVPAPYLHSPNILKGLTYVREGFKVFHYQLRAMVDKDNAENHNRRQRIVVLEQYERLKEKHGNVWEDENEAERQYTLDFLEDVHNCYDETTNYFKLLEQIPEQTFRGNPSRFRYYDLVKAHIANAVFYWPECGRLVNENKGREHFNAKVGWHAEGMHVYFDFLPKYIESMKAAGCHDEELIKDAWVTLMFRAFCWHRCHLLVEGTRVPSEHLDSRLPVYIG